jgi:cyclic beta-1,2-glucan synthetase
MALPTFDGTIHIHLTVHISTRKSAGNRGYGILQPRISIPCECRVRFRQNILEYRRRSLHNRCLGRLSDLFGEEAIPARVFMMSTHSSCTHWARRRQPLLSHDLFEGIYARSALVTDIELDDYPERYDTHARRQHRWARGDWQVAPGALTGPTGDVRTVLNSLPLISRWKISITCAGACCARGYAC